ncbi:MAG: heavy-metal-associated domain-containing protein [Myxococcaceae bacterium]|nr:MAG: heavy-metal-associated domain-containing protein [Myxococcaceae bacterium]
MNPTSPPIDRAPRARAPRRARPLLLGAFAVLGALAAACTPRAAAGQPSASSAAASAVTIPIEGMSCAACAARITGMLRGTAGVVGATVSLEHRSARVEYQAGRVTPAALVAAINALGYRAGAPVPGA